MSNEKKKISSSHQIRGYLFPAGGSIPLGTEYPAAPRKLNLCQRRAFFWGVLEIRRLTLWMPAFSRRKGNP